MRNIFENYLQILDSYWFWIIAGIISSGVVYILEKYQDIINREQHTESDSGMD